MARIQTHRKGATGRSGMAMVIVLFVVAIAIVFALAFNSAQSTSVGIADNARDHARARQVAESGLQIVLNYVQSGSAWRTVMPNGRWVADQPYDGGSYTVFGVDGLDDDKDGIVNGDGNLADGAFDPMTLTVVGRYGNVVHRARAEVRPGAGVVSMIAAFDKIKIKDNARVDSYRSALGPYGTQNVGSEAVLATNAVKKHRIKVEKHAFVAGHAYCGVGGDPDDVIEVKDGAVITGDRLALIDAVSLPIPLPPQDISVSVGDLQYTHGVTVLSGDLHCDRLTIRNTAIVEIEGVVHIVCEDKVEMEDAGEIRVRPGGRLVLYTHKKIKLRDSAMINANTQDPSAALIYHLGSDHIDIEDGSRVYATVVAPWGLLHIKKHAEFFGTFAGRKVEVKDSGQLHHDLSTGFTPFLSAVIDTAMAVSDKIELKNDAVVDSFDSRIGPYDPAGGNQGTDAVISTNRIDRDKIVVKDNAVLYGSAYCGPGGDPSKVIKREHAGVIAGSIGALPAAMDIPHAEPPIIDVNAGNYEHSSGVYTIASDFRCSKFILDGDAVVEIAADVTIYCTGDFIVKENAQIRILPGGSLELYCDDTIKFENQAMVNVNTGDPSLLTLYNLDTQKIELLGASQLCATVYAPDAEFNAKDTARFYGTFKGHKVTAEQNSRLHLDLAGVLNPQANQGQGADEYTVIWVEMQ